MEQTPSIFVEILKIVIPSILASLPGILALRINKERSLIENRKIAKEIETEDASALKLITESAGEVSEHALLIIQELRGDYNELKIRVATLEQSRQFLITENEELRKRVCMLEDGVKRLMEQVLALGSDPVFVLNDVSNKNNGIKNG